MLAFLVLLVLPSFLGVLGLVFGTPGDGDLGVPLDYGAVLCDEFGRHPQFARGLAEVAVGGERRELALGERHFEAADGSVGDRLEGATCDAGFVDECGADQVHRHAIALQHHDQAGERFAAVADEVRGTFQGDREERGNRLGVPDQ